MTTYCIQGNVIDRSNTAGANGRGWSEEVSYTLNVVDRPAVACLNNTGGGMTENEPKVYDSQIYHDFREMTDVCQSVHAQYGTGGNNMPFVVNERGNDSAPAEDQVAVLQGLGDYKMDNVASALKQRDYKDATDLVCGEDEEMIMTYQALGVNSQGDKVSTMKAANNDSNSDLTVKHLTVRRLTPLECERLQGYPSKKYWDISKMTKDEYIAWNLAEGNIIVDAENGKVFGTRGPGGISYDEPKELKGSVLNGYKVYSIRNGEVKMVCRAHRIIWISQHGIIPDGYCIDHINNDKLDNRIKNLQLLTHEENSHKAKEEGLYKTGLDNPATKLDPNLKVEIAMEYAYTSITQRKLAEKYGISKSRIGQIIQEVGWTNIPGASDSKRYKALGNSICLPFWEWLARRFTRYGNVRTIGSLFDGIGGFPLCFKRAGAETLWTSEIEPFCEQVVKYHHDKGEI